MSNFKNRFLSGRFALLLVLILILLGFNFSVAAKEALLRHGQIMLLELAPVDPLSLLQGYYMELDLRAERDIAAALRSSAYDAPDQREGLAVMRENGGVSQFVRIHQGEGLAEGERLLAFKIRDNADSWRGSQVRISSGSFFFEEGQADEYDRARYALLRVSPDGAALIADLCDADKNIIRPVRSE